MPRIAYVDGRYLPLAAATVGVEDRGLQFADAVYEVVAVLNGRLLDWGPHLARLHRSAGAIGLAVPIDDAVLALVAGRLLAANHANDALLYLQLGRGAARRDHGFPADTKPSMVMTVRPFDFAARRAAVETGVAVVTVPDERWARPDIKSVALLPNVLAKEAARRAGAFEAWMVGRDGHVTEGGSTNAWIVEAGVVRTRAPGAILEGVMRAMLIALGETARVRIDERAFTVAEAQAADEAFLTSTTNPCVPVVAIDGARVGDGRTGPVVRVLAAAAWAEIARQTGWTG